MDLSTLSHEPDPRAADDGVVRELVGRYHEATHQEGLRWQTDFRILRLLGRGGQGMVFLCERTGSDGFTLPVALKFFSPETYCDDAGYRDDMTVIARVARQVALVQHDNLLDITNFIERDGIRIMEMEWVDGYNVGDLLTEEMAKRSAGKLPKDRWEYVQRVVLAPGPAHPRFKPGVAIQVLRECLAGLGALHREGIVHGDVKPSNVMLKRTGNAKVIDIGSATLVGKPQARRMWSPVYAAPEVLRGGENTPQSDLAGLGYVLVEMLSGQCPFPGVGTIDDLVAAKMKFDKTFASLLPPDVAGDDMLAYLCRRLIAPDPGKRFPSAQAADLDRKGAAAFHRRLVKGDLASEYANDLRNWLEYLE